MSFDLAPWHMWGSQQTLQASRDSLKAQPETQLIRINYKRPDSWRFMLFARPLSFDPAANLIVYFYLVAGIGRGNIEANTQQMPFCTMFWLPNVNRPPKFCSQVKTPIVDERDPTSTSICDSIVGEDIQLSVNVQTDSNVDTRVTVGAFMAPMHHARPEWWIEKFPGGETLGK